MSTKLRVMDVERFATKDGPGIRTTVFLKGCPLHCPWCSNPESQQAAPQLLWFEKKCTACGACIKACPAGARTGAPGEFPKLDRTLCTTCGACAEACPAGALKISGREYEIKELLDLILRDRDYYETSGGGVTVSGGEPLAQPEVLSQFLRACKEAGLHTAAETCGAFTEEAFRLCAPELDLFLFDIKSGEEERLREVTGADLFQIKKNLKAAVASGAEVIGRVPVIPGFNHSREGMEAIFTAALECGVTRLDLLPYHTLGKNKYAALDRPYMMGDTAMLTKKDLLPWQELARRKGIDARIGG